MSLFTILQCRTHQAGFIRRHVSSTASKVKSHRTLPSAKMRALVSLYHQSDTFITPENLSQRIDEAFVPQETRSRIAQISGKSLKDLHQELKDVRKSPKFRDWDKDAVVTSTNGNALWSSAKVEREWKVMEALYGVDITPSREVLPGLEVLEESVPQHNGEDGKTAAKQALGKKR